MTLLPVWYKGLTPELRRHAELTIGETTDVKARALVNFRRLINEQQDIYSRLDEVFLLRFLRTKKYDVPKAFKLFVNYYNFKTKQRGTFTGKKPSEMRSVIDMGCVLYAPYRLPTGSHVVTFRMGDFDVHQSSAQELVSTVFLTSEMILDCEATQVCGGVFVLDFQGMTVHHYKQFVTFHFISLIINIVQDCLPERIKAIHLVHEPFTFYAVFRLLRPLLKKKIKERVFFHGSDIQSLHKNIPIDYLPESLGGSLGQSAYKEFESYFYSQEPFIERINKYGILDKK